MAKGAWRCDYGEEQCTGRLLLHDPGGPPLPHILKRRSEMQQEDPTARTHHRTKGKDFEPRLWLGKARRKTEIPVLTAGQ